MTTPLLTTKLVFLPVRTLRSVVPAPACPSNLRVIASFDSPETWICTRSKAVIHRTLVLQGTTIGGIILKRPDQNNLGGNL
jgi:hypothetical protein